MKGYLQKTEEGWFVIYDQRTMQDPSAEDGVLPLHPKYASYFNMHLTSTTFLNKEVEFEQEALVDKLDCYQNCVFKTYAKLIEKTDVEKLAEEVYGKGVNYDYEEGYVDGYNKAKENYEIQSSVRELHQYKLGLEDGYNKGKETLYTKEDLCTAFYAHNDTWIDYEEWFKQFKK